MTDQQDTDCLPLRVLDELIPAFLERRAYVAQLTARLTARGWETQAWPAGERIVGRVMRSEFKRRQVPFRIKISTVAFGCNRRMALTNHRSHATAGTPGELTPS